MVSKSQKNSQMIKVRASISSSQPRTKKMCAIAPEKQKISSIALVEKHFFTDAIKLPKFYLISQNFIINLGIFPESKIGRFLPESVL